GRDRCASGSRPCREPFESLPGGPEHGSVRGSPKGARPLRRSSNESCGPLSWVEVEPWSTTGLRPIVGRLRCAQAGRTGSSVRRSGGGAERPCRGISVPPTMSHPPAAGLRGFIGRSSASPALGSSPGRSRPGEDVVGQVGPAEQGRRLGAEAEQFLILWPVLLHPHLGLAVPGASLVLLAELPAGQGQEEAVEGE